MAYLNTLGRDDFVDGDDEALPFYASTICRYTWRGICNVQWNAGANGGKKFHATMQFEWNGETECMLIDSIRAIPWECAKVARYSHSTGTYQPTNRQGPTVEEPSTARGKVYFHIFRLTTFSQFAEYSISSSPSLSLYFDGSPLPNHLTLYYFSTTTVYAYITYTYDGSPARD